MISRTDDSACSVNPSLQPGQRFGVASPANIAKATQAIISACVVERGSGGVAATGKQKLVECSDSSRSSVRVISFEHFRYIGPSAWRNMESGAETGDKGMVTG